MLDKSNLNLAKPNLAKSDGLQPVIVSLTFFNARLQQPLPKFFVETIFGSNESRFGQGSGI